MAVATLRGRSIRRPADQAYLILLVGFVVAPIASGIDKFFNFTVEWPKYLAPWIDRLMPGSAQDFMYVVGVIEIVAGIVVLLSPRWGSLLVAAWLAGIVINLLTYDPPLYYDIAVRDFGLMLGALALNRLATAGRRVETQAEEPPVRRAA